MAVTRSDLWPTPAVGAVCWDGTVDTPLTLVRRLRSDPRRRVVVDAAGTALVGLVLIAVGLVDLVSGGPWSVPERAPNPWWHAVPLLLGCLALLLKERRPLTTLTLVAPLMAIDVALGGSVGMYVVLLDALYSLVLHGPGRWVRPTITTIGVLIVAAAVATFVITGHVQVAALVLLQLFALLGTPVWWGLSVRQHADLAEMARARAEDLQDLADLRRETAVRDERSRMAQDLHDALSSHLSTIAIHSQVVGRQATATGSHDTVGASITQIRTASVRALEDLREMILLLRTGQDQIVPGAGLADLCALVATARGTGLTVRLTDQTQQLPPLPSLVDQAAYRIIQEALANAAKHAPGSEVTVTVRAPEQSRVELAVVSRPRKAPERHTEATQVPGSGLGLQTMGDRATTLGGEFAAGPLEDGAWSVRATLPIEEVLVG